MKQILLFSLVLLFSVMLITPAAGQAQYAVSNDAAGSGQLSQKSYDSLRYILKKMNAGLLNDTVVLKFDYDVVPAGKSLKKENAEIIQQKIIDELKMLHGIQSVRKKISVVELVAPDAGQVTLENNMANTDTDNRVQQLLLKEGITGNSVMLMPGGSYVQLKNEDGWAALKLRPAELQQLLGSNTSGIAKN